MYLQYKHTKGCTAETTYEFIRELGYEKLFLSEFEEYITELREADVAWLNKTNAEFYADDPDKVIECIRDHVNDYEIIYRLARANAKPGECAEVFGGPEEHDEERPYSIYFFTAVPESKEDVLELGFLLSKGMAQYDVSVQDIQKYAVTKYLTGNKDESI